MVVAGRAGKADEALKLFDAFEADHLKPDTACYNAALAACRRSDVGKYADFAKRLWRRCCDDDDCSPDSLTAAEAVACLERAGRCSDADLIFAEALEMGVPLKQARSAGPQGVATSTPDHFPAPAEGQDDPRHLHTTYTLHGSIGPQNFGGGHLKLLT